jgi:DNA-directed RNA polymerase specialized sigma24 family protein
MLHTEEVTQWLVRLGHGDQRAAQAVWRRYFSKLVALARRRLKNIPGRWADEEDVALSAMHSFCRGMAEHRFHEVSDRDDLWKLLVTITARKACAQRRRHFAEKRGGGRVRGESVFVRVDLGEDRDTGIAGVLGEEPTPELACMVAEDCRVLLERLGDERLRQVATLTLEGHSTAEIAQRVDLSQRSVQRKLDAIRQIWSLEPAQ